MMTAGNDDTCIRDELAQKLEETEHKLKQANDALQFEKSKKVKDIEKLKDNERELSKAKSKIEVRIGVGGGQGVGLFNVSVYRS